MESFMLPRYLTRVTLGCALVFLLASAFISIQAEEKTSLTDSLGLLETVGVPKQLGLTGKEKKAVIESLEMLNMTPDDLSYDKSPMGVDAFRLPLITKLLHEPLAIPEVMDELLAPSRDKSKPSKVILPYLKELPGGELDEHFSLASEKIDFKDGFFSELPPEIVPAVKKIAVALNVSRKHAEKAFNALNPEEIKLLKRNIVPLVFEDPEMGLALDPEIRSNRNILWELIKKVELKYIWEANFNFLKVLEFAIEEMKAKSPKFDKVVRLKLDNGTIVLAGSSCDRHVEAADLIIDFGGDDSYIGEASKAWIVDFSGNDSYKGKYDCMASGILGVGFLWDWEGNDVYEAETISQGFGAFGAGFLFDDAGKDVYRSDIFSQACSRTWGVGVLADRAGDDLYQTGTRFLHKPLLDHRGACYSFSQGFSFGYRPGQSGGIAMLWDGEGQDTYTAGTFCQGASYWFAFGALADDGGNDKYGAFHYAQSSAMHMTVAALVDGAGEDMFVMNYGAAHGIGHDWGVAFFWDKAGNDIYAGQSSSPAIGCSNGIGIMIESEGNDCYYVGKPGIGQAARNSGSVGLFVDMGGKDVYLKGLADGETQFHGKWGVARDISKELPGEKKVSKGRRLKDHGPVGSVAMPSNEEMEKIYHDAAVLWGVGTNQEKTWAARRKLVEIGPPAAKWIVENRIGKLKSLAYECLPWFFKEVGPEGRKALAAALSSDDLQKVKEGLNIIRLSKAEELSEEVLAVLNKYLKPSNMNEMGLRRYAILAAGNIKARKAVPVLLEIAKAGDSKENGVLIIAFGKIGDPAAMDFLAAQLANKKVTRREAALDAVVSIGSEALPKLMELADYDNSIEKRMAIKAIGLIDQEESIPFLAEKLEDKDWQVRLFAMRSLLNMSSPKAAEAAAKAKETEKDPRIKNIKVEPKKGKKK